MKRQAFYLVAFVIGLEITLVSSVLYVCLAKGDVQCTNGKVQEHAALILSQVMALYAAEK